MRLIIFLITSVLISACTGKSKPNRNEQLAGMYKLYIAENADSNGVWREDPWTKGGTGYIVYDGMGHMAVHITRQGYNDFTWSRRRKSPP